MTALFPVVRNVSPVLPAALALLQLLAATVLAMYKPRGRDALGAGNEREPRNRRLAYRVIRAS
jgi:hypothetical protein